MSLSWDSALHLAFSLLPVAGFLLALVMLDSYKLVTPRRVTGAILAGAIAAGLAYLVNSYLFLSVRMEAARLLPITGIPILEEIFKALFLMVLFRLGRIGFMVDAAILGFAIGTGFASVENVYYFHELDHPSPLVWLLRGFGTAVMHGGCTALVGVLARSLADRKPGWGLAVFLPGLGLAALVHCLYNLSVLPPVVAAALLLILLPVLLAVVFARSEKSLHAWLGSGFDRDVALLGMLTSGHFTETPMGQYLKSLRRRFAPEVVVDMFCLLRLRVELAIRAKGDLLRREAGLVVTPDPAVREKLAELKFLRESIGPTGLLAMAPLLPKSRRDDWQLHQLSSR